MHRYLGHCRGNGLKIKRILYVARAAEIAQALEQPETELAGTLSRRDRRYVAQFAW